ncbi:MAG: hypothetical protein CL896_03090 [Dehalococcoidia bacterium]|nr:hypothetical protein [Dehalococcoidia bacterium]
MTCIAHNYKSFLFDLDGVIYLGDSVIPGTKETIEYLRTLNKNIRFLTNNPLGTTLDFVKKLNNLGIVAFDSEVFSVGKATASFLVSEGFQDKPVYVIGSEGLKSELRAQGICIVAELNHLDATAVVASVHYDFSYHELMIATQILDQCGVLYGTNRDAVRPTVNGKMPGSGSILAAIETASGIEAQIIGKPALPFMHAVIRSLPASSSTPVIIIGDRLDTDIQAGVSAQIDTALVLTGISTLNDVKVSNLQPDFIIPSIASLTHSVP